MGALTTLTDLVTRAQATEGAELELRVGHLEHGEFTVGCSIDQFHRIHEQLHTNPLIERTPWTKTRSFTYQSNIRVIVDAHGQAGGHISKKPLQSLILPGVHGIAFKISLSTELPCKDPLPTSPPVFVRLRDRQQFFHGRGDQHAWAYDFTRTRGAPTEALAEQADTIYEVELELIGGTTYMHQTEPRDIARSILHRVTDLVRAAHARDQTEWHIRPTNTTTDPTQHHPRTMPTAKLIRDLAEHTPTPRDTHDSHIANTADMADTGIGDTCIDDTCIDDMGIDDMGIDDMAADMAADMATDMATDNTDIDDVTDTADITDITDTTDITDPTDPVCPPTDTEPATEPASEPATENPIPARPTKKKPVRTKKANPPCTPGAPKRPATSFMLFMSENRASINQSLAEAGTPVNLRETSKAGSLRWRNLTPESKAAYVAQAAELHSEWVIRKVVYAAADLEQHDRPDRVVAIIKKKPRKTRNPSEPRRPGSPFVLFMNKHRSEIKESLSESGPSSVTDVGRRGGVLWRELTPEGRQVFTDNFNQLNLAYKLAMAEFKAPTLA